MDKTVIIRGVSILCVVVAGAVVLLPDLLPRGGSEGPGLDLAVISAPAQATPPAEDAPRLQMTETAAETVAETVAESVAESVAEPEQPPLPDVAQAQPAPPPSAPLVQAPEQQADAAPEQPDCTPTLAVTAAFDGLLELALNAPCAPDTRFVIGHGDLAFSAYLGPDGQFSTYIPALAQQAQVDVFLHDDSYLSATALVEDAENYARFVLQWTGDAGFGLHAYHNGAGYGDAGHIHAARPFDPDLEEAFLMSLGELRGPEPMMAQIYSLPLALLPQTHVEVEARFSATQCGQDLRAFLSQSQGAIPSDMKELVFAAPDCPAEPGISVMDIHLAAAMGQH
jgi:hypothetical protein